MTGAKQWISRVSALGVTFLFLTFCWVVLIGPAIDAVAETSNSLIEEQRLKARLTVSLAALKRQDEAFPEPASDILFWQGARQGEIGAAIQSQIGSIARNAQIRLRSSAAIDAAPLAAVTARGFRIEAEAPLDKAVMFLRALERSEPPLVVTRTSLRRLNRRSTSQEQPVVYLRLEVAAPIQMAAKDAP